jgi:hypothetical protein
LTGRTAAVIIYIDAGCPCTFSISTAKFHGTRTGLTPTKEGASMTHGAFRAASQGRRILESPGKTVLLLFVTMGLVFLFSFAGPAGACIVRYDVVSGADNLGNPVSGSIYVESQVSSSVWLGYEIVGYSFHSSALDYSGEGGSISFFPGPNPLPDYPYFSEVMAGNSTIYIGDTWANYSAGVWFYDQVFNDLEQTIANYSFLHPYIRVADLNWSRHTADPYGLGPFIFQAASVPVPPALLLLASGLAGLVGLRSRYHRVK